VTNIQPKDQQLWQFFFLKRKAYQFKKEVQSEKQRTTELTRGE
jgi:hypothetical protein